MMKHNFLKAAAACLVAAGVTAGCVHKTEEPGLSGPSTFARSLTITATPDSINQDGASQSSVAVTAIGPDGKPLSGAAIRMDMMFGGQLADVGTLSARTVVTGNDGTARVVYTAPPPLPPPNDGIVTTVSVRATPIGTDAQTTNSMTADIRLLPVGVIRPPGGDPTAAFTYGPTPVSINVPVSFDASTSKPGTNASRIDTYSWNFGDGGTSQVGPMTTHTFVSGGSFNVTLTVTNDRGLSNATSQAVSVSATDPFTGDWFFSPAQPIINAPVLFNADQVQTSAGHQVTQFNWTFGDGGSGTGFQATHQYTQPGTYGVILSVQDDLGRKKVFSPKALTVGTGNPVPVISFSPGTPSTGTTVNFSSAGTQTFGGTVVVQYQWDFGDGNTGPNAPSVTHVYGAPGTYTVTLTVTDSAVPTGRVGVARVTVTVS